MNIIVVIVDTLRYDYVGANGNNWIHTPNIDRLAAKSWVFDHCYSASYPTIPNRIDTLTGKYGGPFHPWRPLRFDTLTFPQVLDEAGYRTQLIHDTPHLINGGHNLDWPFQAWNFIRGGEVDRPWMDSLPVPSENWQHDSLFDFADKNLAKDSIYDSYFRANRRRKKEEDWNVAKLFLTVSKWLKDNVSSNDNFLLWVDSFDPHEPWEAPPRFIKMYDKTPGYDGRVDPRSFLIRNEKNLSEAVKSRLKVFYAAKVTWMDRWFGELLDTLDQTGLARNTAILFTADHGTNVGERSKFGKNHPVREQEAHIPMFIYLPEGGNGHSNIIVQPQDVFATIMGLAKLPIPDGLDSHNILALVREGKEGPRKLALSGISADNWKLNPEKILFTAFDSDWYLEFTAKPENSRLTQYGSLENVAAENPAIVARMRESALDEIKSRGTDPALMAWLRSNGESEFPEGCRFWDGWPGPAGYIPYFLKGKNMERIKKLWSKDKE